MLDAGVGDALAGRERAREIAARLAIACCVTAKSWRLSSRSMRTRADAAVGGRRR